MTANCFAGAGLRLNESKNVERNFHVSEEASPRWIFPFQIRTLPAMSTRFPCSDYIETRGVVFFARMLDKIRLHASGKLPPGYNVGNASLTSFDARFCRFWEVDFARISELTLQGGSNEDVFDAVLGPKPNPERVLVWNGFLLKRGWRDETSAGLVQDKQEAGFGDRDDIQTFVDFHDADEGRKPRFS